MAEQEALKLTSSSRHTKITTTYRRAMTNPDSILKSRDITLPIKGHLVKAMVFPVVIYI